MISSSGYRDKFSNTVVTIQEKSDGVNVAAQI